MELMAVVDAGWGRITVDLTVLRAWPGFRITSEYSGIWKSHPTRREGYKNYFACPADSWSSARLRSVSPESPLPLSPMASTSHHLLEQ